MEYLQATFNNFVGWTQQKKLNEPKTQPPRALTRFEGYLQIIYKILSWDDISLTLTVFLLLNFLFWVVVQWQLRLLGVVFLCLAVGFIADAYVLVVESCDRYSTPLERIGSGVSELLLLLKTLRRDSPFTFFIGTVMFFLWLSFIGKHMDGYVLFYLCLLKIFFVPLAFTKIPPEFYADYLVKIRNVLRQKQRRVLAEDELIPYISNKNFAERDPDMDSLLTDQTVDSVTNSLISGITSMPSYLDADDTQTFIEEEDLMPSGILFTPRSGDLSSSDSDEHHIKDIRFDSGHFNNGGNGSSDDEDEAHFSRNMTFSEEIDAATETRKDQVDRLVGNLLAAASVSGNLMANAIKSAVSATTTTTNPVVTPKKKSSRSSSSESEFEIINSDEAANLSEQ